MRERGNSPRLEQFHAVVRLCSRWLFALRSLRALAREAAGWMRALVQVRALKSAQAMFGNSVVALTAQAKGIGPERRRAHRGLRSNEMEEIDLSSSTIATSGLNEAATLSERR